MRTLHASKVLPMKIKNDDKIIIEYNYEQGEETEKFTLECGESPHIDFITAWKELRDEIRKQLKLAENRMLHLKNISIDYDDMFVKADLTFTMELYANPAKIQTPKLEVNWEIVETVAEEAALYVTREKRAQADLFADSVTVKIEGVDPQEEDSETIASDESDPVEEFDTTIAERRRNEVVGFR